MLTSELPDDEVVLEEDPIQMSKINTVSFTDVQEWKLYDEVQILKGSLRRFQQMDETDDRLHSYFSCRTNAARRSGFFVYSVFLIMASQQQNAYVSSI